MSLRKYLENNKIDQIEDDQEFMEAEYEAVKTYCEICGYSITEADLNTIKSIGLEESYVEWKRIYVCDLWEDFGEVPMNSDTEEIEEQWRHFLPGTRREEIWHWFEEQFNISVAEDLMGQEEIICQSMELNDDVQKKINKEKLTEYIANGSILEFESDQKCLEYFNTYDFQNFRTIEEMKVYQNIYGFNIGNKRYHIDVDNALDVYDI